LLRFSCLKYSIIIVLIILTSAGTIHSRPDLEELILKLQTEDPDKQKEIFDNILLLITDIDPVIAQKQAKRLLNLTKKIPDLYCYNHVLLFYARYGSYEEQKNNAKASILLAEQRNDLLLKAKSYGRLSEIYKENLQYDSMIILLFKARDIFRTLGDKKNEVNMLHDLGNIYFVAGLLDKAEYCFKEVYKLRGDLAAWKEWRKFVITNNFGLIESKRSNYDKAIFYYLKALNDMLADKNNIMGFSDSVRMVYLYSTLSEFYFTKKNMTVHGYIFQRHKNLIQFINILTL